jgi:SAM-dependent methyltransferase
MGGNPPVPLMTWAVAAAVVIFVGHVPSSTDALSSSSSSRSPLPDELLRALRSSQPPATDNSKANLSPLASSSSAITIFNLLSPTDRSRLADAPDEAFYSYAMLVQHNDDAFRRQLSALYSEVLDPGGGGTFLDLGSSWVSHLPDEPRPSNIWLHGMNREELDRNPAGNGWKIVKSFNDPSSDEISKMLLSSSGASGDNSITTTSMLLPEIPDVSVDVVGICAAFQYWRFPERVVGEILRVLKPGGCCVVSFSNRMFASKAVGAWSSRTADRDRLRYVCDVLTNGARIMEASTDGGSKTTYGLKVERTLSNGSAMAAITAPISIMLGYQPLGDPFLAVVANKQPSSI